MTSVNATTFSPQQTSDVAGVAIASLCILLGLIAFVIAIVTPSGFCSIRRRWIRRMKRAFGAAGETLMTEIRGEEFYAVPLEDMASVDSDADAPDHGDAKEAVNEQQDSSSNTKKERDMIAMYKQRGIL